MDRHGRPVTTEEHRAAGNFVKRWVLTHIGKDGERTLTQPRQGRYTYDTRTEVERHAEAIMENNTPERIASVYGSQAVGTFEAREVECWIGHFDPVTCWFD